MKNLAFLVVTIGALSSCGMKVPYTEDIKKEYGLDGTSKLKSSAESKRLKALAELAAKESGDKK